MAAAGDLNAGWLGVAIFWAAVALAGYLIVSRSRAAGLLAPVLIGGGLRLAVMLIAHAGSGSLGEGGLMFVDDVGYAHQAAELATAWGNGEFVNPADAEFTGSNQFGYPALVGAVFTLVGDEVLLAKLVNVLLGTATVLVAGLIAQDVLGPGTKRRAAWLVALAPGVVWWSAPMVKEALAMFLASVGILAALRLPRSGLLLCGAVAALVFVRSPWALIILACLAVGLGLAARQTARSIRWWRLGATALAGGAVVLAVVTVLSAGDPLGLVKSYPPVIENMIEKYQGSNLALVPGDVFKALVSPFPWAFDAPTRNWDRGLYPGMWVWFLVYPVAAIGAWRLRRRPEIALLALPIVLSVVIYSFISGPVFRQRSTVEPLLLLVACAGMWSWRSAVRIGSAALPLVGVVAAAQSGSLLLGATIAVAGGALFAAAGLLPREELRLALPPSPLVGIFERFATDEERGRGGRSEEQLGRRTTRRERPS